MIQVSVDCIVADKPTANNRIYSKDTLVKMVELANKRIEDKSLYVVHDRYDYDNPTTNIMGMVNSCKYDENSGKIQLEVAQLEDRMDIATLLESKLFRITPNVIGELEHNHVVKVQELTAFSIMPDHPAEPKE